MKEIVSLQFGHYANFVGTHWWNIQETGFSYSPDVVSEINHDVLFREGVTHKGETTFTPRLLLADLKGSLRSLPELGDLYGIPDSSVRGATWLEDAVEVIEEKKVVKNTFQKELENPQVQLESLDAGNQLEEDVKVWSDFLYSKFHPRTVNLVKEYHHESQNSEFDVSPLGVSLWKTTSYGDEFSDKIRVYVEECDSLQGFHVTVDAVNAFSGLANSCVEDLRDEYDKKCILTFPVIPGHYSDYEYTNTKEREESTKKDNIRMINLALCLENLAENSSLVVPLSVGSKGFRQPGPKRTFNYVNYNEKSAYHTSAILASALETFTLPYRKKSSHFSLTDFCADLNNHGRKISAASLCLPFSMQENADLINVLDDWEGPLWQNLTPNCSLGTDKMMQIVSVRGVSEDRLKRNSYDDKSKKQREMPAYRCETVQEMITFYLSCISYCTASNVCSISSPLSVQKPFPTIFDNTVSENGDILDFPRPVHQRVKNLPVISGCHTGTQVGDMLENVHRETTRIKISRYHQFLNSGLETDEYKESMNRLLDLRECYEDSYE